MGFGQAISAGFSNYVNFPRSGLPVGILVLGSFLLPRRLRHAHHRFRAWDSGDEWAFGLVTFIPTVSVAIRRLHDSDRTGWWYLLIFVLLIGWIILLIWYVTKDTDGPNRFGPDPLTTLVIPPAPRAA